MSRLYFTLLFLATVVSVSAQTLHAVLVSDVENQEFGMTSQVDEEKILTILKTASAYTGLKLKPTYLNRAQFTAPAVRKALAALPVQPKDIVFFYYTGPGTYASSTSKFPSFQLKENVLQQVTARLAPRPLLSLDEVGNILQKKGSRLNIVLADCRNSADSLEVLLGTSGPDEDLRRVYIKKLFLGSCGLVKVASAAKDQKVWARLGDGSVYTDAFVSLFDSELRGGFPAIRQANWPQFLAMKKSVDVWVEKSDIIRQQESVYEIIPGTTAQQRLTTRYPAYINSRSVGEVQTKINDYLSDKVDFLNLKNEIDRAFLKNAPIHVISRNKYPASDARSQRKEYQTTIGAYLEHVREKVSEIKEIEVDFTSLKRTPNYEYIAALTFIETWEEVDPAK